MSARDLNLSEIQRLLDLPAHTTMWLKHIERPADSSSPVLPNDVDAKHLLEQLGVEAADRDATLAARPALLDVLPRETTLQRAIVTHLRANGHWYNRTGWLPFKS
jgi:hypothetical protein